jgi:hypothetical protein
MLDRGGDCFWGCRTLLACGRVESLLWNGWAGVREEVRVGRGDAVMAGRRGFLKF